MKKYIKLLYFVSVCQASIAQNITKMEYFIDEDPGYGEAYLMDIPDSDDIDFSFNIDLSGLELGHHNLYTRVFDSNGIWSHTSRRQFEIIKNIASTSITTLEWSFNEDKGIGNCDSIITFDTPIPFGAFTFYLPVEEFPTALDTIIFLRVHNNPEGSWSHTLRLSVIEINYVNTDNLITYNYSMFPNPVNSIFNIKTQTNNSVVFKIHDIYGNLVLIGDCTAKLGEIDVAHLSPGIYFLSLNIESFAGPIKFIKI